MVCERRCSPLAERNKRLKPFSDSHVARLSRTIVRGYAMRTASPGGSGLTFQFSCQSVQLGIQCSHLGTFLVAGHCSLLIV